MLFWAGLQEMGTFPAKAWKGNAFVGKSSKYIEQLTEKDIKEIGEFAESLVTKKKTNGLNIEALEVSLPEALNHKKTLLLLSCVCTFCRLLEVVHQLFAVYAVNSLTIVQLKIRDKK